MYVPRLRLDELYGTAPLYSARASDARCRWLLQDRVARDALSGGLLPMAGQLETLCSRSLLTPLGLELLARAGLDLPARVHPFDGPDDYLRKLRRLSEDRPVVLHHRHAPEELPEERYWIPAPLLSALNDKAHLAEWVPEKQVARRAVLPPSALAGSGPRPSASSPPLRPPLRPPVWVKVAGPDSTGGGFGLRSCRDEAELRAAVAWLAGVEHVVVEEWLPAERSLCLHYGVDRAGHVTFLAAADQVMGADGHHDGNWLGLEPAPKEAVDTGAVVVAAAWRRGYYGLVGIDVLVLPDGSHRVIDLNFRVNSSSGPALLWDAVRSRHPGTVVRSRRLRFPEGLAPARARLEGWIDEGRLLPLSVFDADAGPWRGQPSFVHALVLGESPAEVSAWLGATGLVPRPAPRP